MSPFRHCLLRQCEHHVDVDVIKTASPREAITLQEIGYGVDTAELLQRFILHRLQPETESIHPGFLHHLQFFRVKGVRVAFHRDFRIRTDLEMRT